MAQMAMTRPRLCSSELSWKTDWLVAKKRIKPKPVRAEKITAVKMSGAKARPSSETVTMTTPAVMKARFRAGVPKVAIAKADNKAPAPTPLNNQPVPSSPLPNRTAKAGKRERNGHPHKAVEPASRIKKTKAGRVAR